MQMRVVVTSIPELRAALERIDPGENKRILRDGFIAAANEIQADAAKHQIKRRGKNAPPIPKHLTSRHGGAGLVGSIRVNHGPLPFAIEVGTDRGYGPTHEFGGRVSFPSSRVSAHTRRMAFGRRVKPFTVPAHTRSAYSASYPRRPFLKPALDKIAPRFGDIFLREWKKAARL